MRPAPLEPLAVIGAVLLITGGAILVYVAFKGSRTATHVTHVNHELVEFYDEIIGDRMDAQLTRQGLENRRSLP